MNQIKFGALLSYLGVIFSILLPLIYTPYLIGKLGQSEYGLFALVSSMVAFLAMLDLGFGNAIIRYISKYRIDGQNSKLESIIGLFLILYGLMGLVTLIIGFYLVSNIGLIFSSSLSITEINVTKVLLIISVVNVAISLPMTVFVSIIYAYEKFIFIRVVQIIRTLINAFLIISILFLGFKSIGVMLSTTILNIAFLFLNVAYCFYFLKIKIRFVKVDKLLLKEIIVYSFFIFLHLLSDRISISSGQFLLGVLSGPEDVAVYSLGAQFNTYYISLAVAISGLLIARVMTMSLDKADNTALSSIFIKFGRIQFALLSYILIGFILVGKDFILLWVGIDYVNSFYVSLILMISFTVPLIQSVGVIILQARNQHHFYSILFLCMSILGVFISIPFIKIYGVFGSAFGVCISIIVGQVIIMNIYYYIKKINIIKFWIEILKMLPALLIIFSVVYAFKTLLPLSGFSGLFVYTAIYSILFIFIMFIIGFNKYERSILYNPLKNIYYKVRGRNLNG